MRPGTPWCPRPTPMASWKVSADSAKLLRALRSGPRAVASELLCQEIQPSSCAISGQVGRPRCQAIRTSWVSSSGGGPTQWRGAIHTARFISPTCHPRSVLQEGVSTSTSVTDTGSAPPVPANRRSSPKAAASWAAWVAEFSRVCAQAASSDGRASLSSASTCGTATEAFTGTPATSRAQVSPGRSTGTLTCTTSAARGRRSRGRPARRHRRPTPPVCCPVRC